MISRWRARRTGFAVVVCMLSAMLAPGTADAQPAEKVRYVVGFHNFAPHENASEYGGAAVIRRDEVLRFLAVETASPEGLNSHANQDPNVRYVEPDQQVRATRIDLQEPVPSAQAPDSGSPSSTSEPPEEDPPVSASSFTPNDALYSTQQYGPQQIGAPYAWDFSRGDTDAAVCIVDTGIRRSHQDIGTARWLGWADVVNGGGSPYDDNGHGTHVAGIAVATINNALGIAGIGNVGIYGAKALDHKGDGFHSDIASAIRWCAQRPVSRTVINLSLGGPTSSTVLADALSFAYNTQNRLLAAAAGNSDCTDCIEYPARSSLVIAVTCNTEAQTRCPQLSNR